MHTRGIATGIVAGLASIAAQAAYAQGNDEQCSVTVETRMTRPMSTTLPPFTTTVCTPPDADQGPPPMQQGDCKVEQYAREGDRRTYRVACMQGGTRTVGEGWTEKSGTSAYRGEMRMASDDGGVAMDMSYAGTLTGSCTAGR